jgi:hypothetical protein
MGSQVYSNFNYPSLTKRGKGKFLDDALITKIPPNLPFPKGGISSIFMILCGPTVHARSARLVTTADRVFERILLPIVKYSM